MKPIYDFNGQVALIAGAVLWLCSSTASFVVTSAVPVDSGFTAH